MGWLLAIQTALPECPYGFKWDVLDEAKKGIAARSCKASGSGVEAGGKVQGRLKAQPRPAGTARGAWAATAATGT